MKGSMEELGKKFKRTLAGNWWVGAVTWVVIRMDLGWKAGGEKGRKEIMIWMEVAENE